MLKTLNINSQANSVPINIGKCSDFLDSFSNPPMPSNSNNNTLILNKYENNKFPLVDAEFTFTEITSEVIDKIISKLKSTAKGSDGIELKMILLVTPFLSDHLAFLMNKCLTSGFFPSVWKDANIIPVPKVSNPSLISHFRPISILPTLSKILEKIVSEQVTVYINNFNILPPTQSGFRAQYSTSTALLKVTDDIFKETDLNNNICLILLDFSKAFDTLDHATLCTKLKYYGFSNTAVSFFNNYLSARRQRVVLNNESSHFIEMSRGVPQGSILGPLLFSIYTADFNEYLKYCQTHQYADDTQVYYSFNLQNLLSAVTKINDDLQIISEVSSAHSLILNEAKTELLVFGSKRVSVMNDPEFKIKLNGNTLVPGDCCKNLGLWIDNNLRFSKHVNHLVQKSFGKLKLLYTHKDFLSSDVKLKLCDSLILSALTYCDIVYWPALLNRDKVSLQMIQNQCLRFTYNLRKFDHISTSFVASKWLNLNERFNLHMSCSVFKILKYRTPEYLATKLVKNSDLHMRSTRHRDLFCIPKHSSAQFQRSFSYNAVKNFNALPENVKSLSSLTSFKKSIKNYLFASRV